ncbi:putative tail assembly chaperone protein [Erwinia phage Fifi44]|uniref:Tail assembly chaperone protein n=1 Tax=Erwinia phage Fifi44 TaxID=2876597 RepID=A0AAE9C0F9_9CAUD|nr:putative tail assembly chaperone protein [Erwinia phage Fifi44]QQV88366.1 putative tail assembly chaperone protein [Erwinia phage pEa_SNUABM_27]UCR74932.1 putative tail assembly chaperone protein [Erwinia phage Fifi44]UCR80835.1 putative tail assembly chaperone protein [Erwinia phage Fifi451]WJN63697.1 putative tail protein [Erwinia phage Aioli]
MACELLTREFKTSEGVTKLFTTRQLAASSALDLHVELIGKVGTTVFPLIDNNYNFGDIIAVMRQADNKVVTDLMKRVICNANIEGQPITMATFDIHFNGELMLACQVFAFVLEANYKAFFKLGLEMNEQFKLAEAERLEAERLAMEASQKNTTPTT